MIHLRAILTISVLTALATLALLSRGSALASFVAPSARDKDATTAASNAAATPVLVELFTSEGCSSCPPADALLSRFAKTQPVGDAEIIALEEHVNYWDRLGWKDPFSSEAATARQSEYGAAFGGEQVYTPQMVVDGRAEFVGSSNSDALRAIRAASRSPKPAVQLSWQPASVLNIHVDPLTNASAGAGAQVFLVIAENMLRTDVKRGENAGRALEHNGVARQFLPVGTIDAAAGGFSSSVAVHADREWNRKNLRAVVFVQERRSRHILAAAAVPFSD